MTTQSVNHLNRLMMKICKYHQLPGPHFPEPAQLSSLRFSPPFEVRVFPGATSNSTVCFKEPLKSFRWLAPTVRVFQGLDPFALCPIIFDTS
jgi:hypothetical protein